MQPEPTPSHAPRYSYAGRWVVALCVALGISAGIGLYTFRYAEGLSYLSTEPKACMNCHIMRPQYDSWLKSSHHNTALCVDCHLPHSFFAKYAAKLENGYRHSEKFTTQAFEEPIRVQPRGLAILQANCVECHNGLTHDLVSAGRRSRDEPQCVHCHSSAGHGERSGLGPPLHYARSKD